MARSFLTPINLNQLELLNAVVQNLATAPGTPAEGQVYFDTALDALRVFANGAWVTLGAVGGGGPPTGTAGGDLTGSYPNPTLAAGSVSDADVNAAAAIQLSKLATNPLARANHTGDQTASTISDFNVAVRTNRLDQMAVPTATVSMNGQTLREVGYPSFSHEAANRGYVDSVAAGLSWKAAVKARSATNVDVGAYAGAAIDGVTIADGDRVLLTGQTDPLENGIWVYASAVLSPAEDFVGTGQVTNGTAVFVTEGTSADTGWVLTSDDVLWGTDPIAFTQFTGAEIIVAGDGLTKTGSTVDVGAGTGMIVAANAVGPDFALVARRYAGDVPAGTACVITHNLGTRDVAVQVYLNSGTYESVECDVERTSTTTVTLRFAVAVSAAAYRAVVTA